MMISGAPPGLKDAEKLVAVNVKGNTMLPLYRHGDTLLVAKDVPVKFGDRVVVESRVSGWLGGTLVHHNTEHTVLIRGGNPKHDVTVPAADLRFFGRIVWASQ